MILRSAHNYDRNERSVATGLLCSGDGRTVQDEAEDADINVIMRRFGVTGALPEAVRPPTYGDFTQVGDFRSAMEAIRLADEAFMEMPAEVRSRFHHDPQEFVEFCSDKANLPEMRKLGLADPEKVVDTPVQAPAVPA